MRNGPLASNTRVLVFALASALLLMTLVTAQVALAGPSTGVGGQTGTNGTVPTATATSTSVDTPTPAPPTNTPLPRPPLPTVTPGPPDGIPPGPPDATPVPPVAPPVTAAYDWLTVTVIDVPVFEPEPTATPAPDGTTTSVLDPDATATPTPEPAPKVALKVPARSMNVGGQPASGQITVRPVKANEAAEVSADTLPDRPRLTFAGRSVEINVYGQTATSGPADITDRVRFNPPLEIGFDITQEEWDAAGGDITAFEVRFFSVQENRWIVLAGTVDPFPPRRVTAIVTHLTSFGLFIEPAEEGAGAPDGGDYSLGMGGAGMIAFFGVTLIILGFYVRRRGISGA